MSKSELSKNESLTLVFIREFLENHTRVTFDVSGTRGEYMKHPNLKYVASMLDLPYDGYERIKAGDYCAAEIMQMLEEKGLTQSEIGKAVKGLKDKHIGFKGCDAVIFDHKYS